MLCQWDCSWRSNSSLHLTTAAVASSRNFCAANAVYFTIYTYSSHHLAYLYLVLLMRTLIQKNLTHLFFGLAERQRTRRTIKKKSHAKIETLCRIDVIQGAFSVDQIYYIFWDTIMNTLQKRLLLYLDEIQNEMVLMRLSCLHAWCWYLDWYGQGSICTSLLELTSLK